MLNVRLTPDIHTKIAVAASEMGITINGYIRQVLELTICCLCIDGGVVNPDFVNMHLIHRLPIF